MPSDISFSMPGYRAEAVTASQELIMQVAKLSNFNVLMQQKSRGGISSEFRLFCKKCGGSKTFDDWTYLRMIVSDQTTEPSKFCTDHAHEVKAPVAEPVGRRFREE